MAAFAVSAVASQWERTGKPFNPLLGETYELIRYRLVEYGRSVLTVDEPNWGHFVDWLIKGRTRGTGWSRSRWATTRLSVPSMPSLWRRSLSFMALSTPNSSSGAKVWRPSPKAPWPWSCWSEYPWWPRCVFYSISFVDFFILSLLILARGEKVSFVNSSCHRTNRKPVILYLCLVSCRHKEAYTWTNPMCCVHNIILGKLWIEQYGTVEIINHRYVDKNLKVKPQTVWSLLRVDLFISKIHQYWG